MVRQRDEMLHTFSSVCAVVHIPKAIHAPVKIGFVSGKNERVYALGRNNIMEIYLAICLTRLAFCTVAADRSRFSSIRRLLVLCRRFIFFRQYQFHYQSFPSAVARRVLAVDDPAVIVIESRYRA